jgi:hypothetical protein
MSETRLGWKRVTLRLLFTALLFGLVGPLIGVFVFWGVGMPLLVDDPGAAVWGPVFVIGFFWITIPVTYMIGGGPAIVTGLVVCGLSALRLPSSGLYAAAALTGATTSASMFWTGGLEQDPTLMAATGIAGLVSALACTRFTRRWRLAPPESFQGAGGTPAV